MSTAIADRPIEQQQVRHTVVLGNTRFWCIQPHCDGKHHVMCSCGHRAA